MPVNLDLPLETNQSAYPNVNSIKLENDVLEAEVVDRYGSTIRLLFNPQTFALVGGEQTDNVLRLRNKSDDVAHTYFRVWFGRDDWAKDDWRYLGDDTIYQFNTGKEANAKAKELSAESQAADSPWRFMVKPYTEMSPDHNWRGWMEDRFVSGEYSHVPWKDEPWAIKDHFAHPALADPFKIAYVNSEVEGVADKMTVLAPGRYLQKFYDKVLTPQEISQWAVKLDNEAELLFAKTPEEIVHVYTESGIASCMSYKPGHSNFSGSRDIHPTSVYGAGDLELAYLQRKNKIVGRALVRRSNMKIGRLYGDTERLKARLQAEGFTYADGDAQAFVGAKIKRIDMGGDVVMPYLDWNLKARIITGDDEHLQLTLDGRADGKVVFAGSSTNGLSTGVTMMTCSECGEPFISGAEGSRYHARTGRNICPTCSAAMISCDACGNTDDADHMLPEHNGMTNEPVMRSRARGATQRHICTHQCAGSGTSGRNYVNYERRAYFYGDCTVREGGRTRVPVYTTLEPELV